MANPMMEPLEPYQSGSVHDQEPHEDYDWDYEDEPVANKRPMNVVWGRVGLLGAIVLFAFLLGRMSGGGGEGVPASDLTKARDNAAALEQENTDLSALNTQLQNENTELRDQLTTAQAADSGDQDQSAASGSEDTTTSTGQEYVVKSGDTLQGIAIEFYDDPSLDDYLAEVNNISDPTALHVGQKLIIPDDPPSQ